jgi:hypothetical protein
MKPTLRRRLALASAALLAAVIPIAGLSPANAYIQNNVGPVALASNGNHTVTTISYDFKASWKYLVTASVFVDKATASRVLVGPAIFCGGQQLSLASQNITSGQAKTNIVTHAVYDGVGVQNCQLVVNVCVPGNCTTPSGSASVTLESGSYLRVETIPNTGEFAIPPAETLVTSTTAYDTAPLSYLPPAGTTIVNAVADVNVTDCIPSSDNKPAACTTTANATANVGVRLDILQWNSNHTGYCATTSYPTSPALQQHGVTWQEHHYHFTLSGIASVNTSPQCSNAFRIKVYTKLASGNPFVVQGRVPGQATGGTLSYSSTIAWPS